MAQRTVVGWAEGTQVQVYGSQLGMVQVVSQVTLHGAGYEFLDSVPWFGRMVVFPGPADQENGGPGSRPVLDVY